ncbi:MAG: mevalonate kinase [Candidatus Altiarchaeales archaeon]|nr:mevalonate kinase [Candidatus Altiarchaeota archaeon]MBU4341153.1 mevalonate kinase [Candidatus Altiarchaeota archaeon]MBU4406496.1 mevalonate kinase [Candidatus Altiarchaeota archaeon]MBU4437136.1 mevalonate kinase [Candidatus Altiarchaeota archaeon]MCG2783074.1 mevalonate kinase [Candidatus Altiarchaeales archaeon]
MATKASAPGKVILLGEHAAVYGNPVLVATVNLRTYVTVSRRDDNRFTLNNDATQIENLEFSFSDIPKLKKEWNTVLAAECIEKTFAKLGIESGLDIEISSEAPVSSGLGSSASAASAMVLAIAREFDRDISNDEIANLAWDIENIVHGKSSGVDPFSVTFGGVLRYQKGKFKKLKVKKYPEITIGNTGVISNTGDIVMDVMKVKDEFPKFFENYLEAMVHVVDYGQKFLEKGKMKEFGQIMNINQGLLYSIGVSSPELDRIIWAARENSLGAKLCGAGRGGIMIALGDAGRQIEEADGSVVKTEICDEGVRVE